MSETKPSETKPKMISKNVAVALGIICIILVVGLVGAFAYYIPIINDKNNTISSYNSQVSHLESNVTNLQNQVNNLTDILNLRKSIVWVSGEVNLWDLGLSYPYEENATYAGYIVVQVSSRVSDIFVEVRYSSHGVNYNNSISLDGGGTAIFPVLSSSKILIFVVYNPPQIPLTGPIDATVTITYYY